MPKLKTKRGAAKRFKRTANGKIKLKRAFKSHIQTKMSPKRVRQLRKGGYVSKANQKQVERMIPY